MYVPLVILAVFAVGVGWSLPGVGLSVESVLEQARPAGPLGDGVLLNLHYPDEHASHNYHTLATIVAFSTAAAGFILATLFYGMKVLNADEVRKQFRPIYTLLWNKWYFDELYNAIFVRPSLVLARAVAQFDKQVIDRFIDGCGRATVAVANFDDAIDRYLVDGLVNLIANWTYSFGLSLRALQTGKLRQYVMFIVVGTVGLFVLISFYWSYAQAGN
jgi:NADH-quinone oxidoreductase subunit L